MIAQTDLVIARELRSQLDQHLAGDQVRVFGSRARGDADQDSDFDVLVVLEKNTRQHKELVRTIAWEIGLKHGVVISTIVIDRHELTGNPATLITVCRGGPTRRHRCMSDLCQQENAI